MRTLIIDGDVVAYQAACVNQRDFQWDEETISRHLTPDTAFERIQDELAGYLETLKADRLVICLTDGVNWRKDILPSYKENRKDVERPELLAACKQYLMDNYETYLRPTLEGDDCLGILLTHPTLIAGDKVAVGIDKDFHTLPGHHYNPSKPDLGVIYLTEAEADLWHLRQALSGDTTDGYAGCPGMGPGRADEWCADPYKWVSYEHTFKRGPRAGETETRWSKEPLGPEDTLWSALVSCYERQGLTEEDALIQAQVARICRASDFDFKNKEVILWMPK